MTTHLIIPDTQVRPGVNLDYLDWIGKYIVHKKPDVIVQLGDFADMHSLGKYDMGKKAGEGARVNEDIDMAIIGMERLLDPLIRFNKKQARLHRVRYAPRMVLTLGNHEHRITRHINEYPYLSGFLSLDDLQYKQFGWEVYPFLEVVEIDGIAYSHFFPRSASGHIVQTTRGAPSARLQVIREGRSCTAGHQQGLDWHAQPTGDGIKFGLIAGSCYTHEEDYLSPQGQNHWKGIILKNDVHDGVYDPIFVSLDYLRRKFGE